MSRKLNTPVATLADLRRQHRVPTALAGGVLTRRATCCADLLDARSAAEKAQASLQTYAQRRTLVEDDPDPVRLGGYPQEEQLFARTIPSPTRKAWGEKSNRRGRRIHS